MWEREMLGIKLPISIEQFHQLPRNPAFKYEYFDNHAYLSPRPKTYHAILDLRPFMNAAMDGADSRARLRPLVAGDWEWMPDLFSATFCNLQPFGSLDERSREEATRACLERTRNGGDGPLIERASFVAMADASDQAIGAILLTLIPSVDLSSFDGCEWQNPPPPESLERRMGRAHLTWIFVSPLSEGQGLGTALLSAAVRELLALGYFELASTFLLGNQSTMLWHWRNGFRLLPYAGSKRELKKRLENKRDL